jgi:protein-disulfide isomerase
METHRCHAERCKTPCPPTRLMCTRHWAMVPYHLQKQVWRFYRIGQETDKQPSAAYLEAAKDAIAAVSRAEREKRTERAKRMERE